MPCCLSASSIFLSVSFIISVSILIRFCGLSVTPHSAKVSSSFFCSVSSVSFLSSISSCLETIALSSIYAGSSCSGKAEPRASIIISSVRSSSPAAMICSFIFFCRLFNLPFNDSNWGLNVSFLKKWASFFCCSTACFSCCVFSMDSCTGLMAWIICSIDGKEVCW